MKLSEQEVAAELKQAGFAVAQRLDILPYQYFVVFKKR
jgi:hypothetical protein